MPLLNEADEIYLGEERAEQVYLGDTQAWIFATAFAETMFEPLGAFVTDPISTS